MKNPEGSLILSRVENLKEIDLAKLLGGSASSADDKVGEISVIYDRKTKQTKADVNGHESSTVSRP